MFTTHVIVSGATLTNLKEIFEVSSQSAQRLAWVLLDNTLKKKKREPPGEHVTPAPALPLPSQQAINLADFASACSDQIKRVMWMILFFFKRKYLFYFVENLAGF